MPQQMKQKDKSFYDKAPGKTTLQTIQVTKVETDGRVILSLQAGEAATAGKVGMIKTDGKGYKHISTDTYMGLVKGVILNDCATDALMELQISGPYENDDLDLDISKAVFVYEDNIVQTPLTEKEADANVFTQIGAPIAWNTLIIEIKEEFYK